MYPLSKSFDLEDFTRSSRALTLKIDNTPSKDIIERLEILAGVLEHIQGVTGLTLGISSGYRSPALNVAVGGVPTSGHCLGWAADVYSSVKPEDIARQIKATGIKFDQLIYEHSGPKEWVHFSTDPRFRGQVLKMVNGKYSTWTL